jgi:CRISPR-associated protein Csb1
MSQSNFFTQLLAPNGPVALIIKARLKPVGDQDRFQPAGFPHVGHVIYDAPRPNGQKEKVCIVDSPASMANHLEAVCLADSSGEKLHSDLEGLPYVICVTDRQYTIQNGKIVLDPNDPKDKPVTNTFIEGHRLASDYFLDARLNGQRFRDVLREEFGIREVKKDSIYFVHPEDWWKIYSAIFKYDPNSLVHGVMFTKEQIRIPRFLTAHLEAYGASRVGRGGVKFDRLGKTSSGQPIFAVDEETAREICATFIVDLAWLRSLGNKERGLNDAQKRLILGFALWKVRKITESPWRYRTQCYLKKDGCLQITLEGSSTTSQMPDVNPFDFDIKELIRNCEFGSNPVVTRVYYPANELFKVQADEKGSARQASAEESEVDED